MQAVRLNQPKSLFWSFWDIIFIFWDIIFIFHYYFGSIIFFSIIVLGYYLFFTLLFRGIIFFSIIVLGYYCISFYTQIMSRV